MLTNPNTSAPSIAPTTPSTPADATSSVAALRKLKARMPAADAGVASGVQAANQMKIQQLAGGAPASTDASQLNQAGAALASTAGQQQVAKTQAAQAPVLQSAQNVVAARRSEAQSAVAGRELQVAAAQRGNELKLSQMDSELKRELVDARTRFATDEAGRLVLNAEQLADLAATKATSREDLANKLQSMEHVSKRKLLAVDLMYKKAMQELQARTSAAIQQGNQQAVAAIADYRNQIMKQFQEEVAKAQNNAMLFSGILGIAGAVVGGIYGGPAGAGAGYAVGTGAGNILAGTGAADQAFNTK